ncbi:conserved hypothetical protein [Ricinus communis]|uniref:RALFL33 n=1 Tax=Ricinus communis TaxID=3988 RepID=B9SBV1_RICCO|nr:conserved hypothetical protein [Ricinus communis]
MMAIPEKLTVFCLGMLLCMSLLARDANATTLGNGAMEGDHDPACGPESPQGCKKGQANKYSRGCEKGEECRGPTRTRSF